MTQMQQMTHAASTGRGRPRDDLACCLV